MPSAEIISIGSELLLGQIVDTNSAWMSDRLSGLGVNLFYQSTVGYNFNRMHFHTWKKSIKKKNGVA